VSVKNIGTHCPECGYDSSKGISPKVLLTSIQVSRKIATTLFIGIVIAAIISFIEVPILHFGLTYINVLIHELGHALFGWLSGYQSIPAFDIHHGGGVTMHLGGEPNKIILAGVIVVWGALIHKAKRHPALLVTSIAGGLIWGLCLFLGWDRTITLYAGHGGSLAMAGVFIFRGFSSISVESSLARVTYFTVAAFMLIEEFTFTHNIQHDAMFRNRYLDGKGGIVNDFDQLSDILPGNMFDLMNLHSALCLSIPICAYAVYTLYNVCRRSSYIINEVERRGK